MEILILKSFLIPAYVSSSLILDGVKLNMFEDCYFNSNSHIKPTDNIYNHNTLANIGQHYKPTYQPTDNIYNHNTLANIGQHYKPTNQPTDNKINQQNSLNICYYSSHST